MKPLIICAALTGSAPAKSRSPYHPSTPAEVATAAVDAWRAGAAMVHIHARAEDGTATTSIGDYEAIISQIRAQGCDAIINVSAGDNGGRANHEERMLAVKTSAEVVSLGAGSFNLGNRLYDNSPKFVRSMAKGMQNAGVVPAIEVFDFGHLDLVGKLVSEGLIASPAMVEFVFGLPGGMPADPRLLPYLIEHLPQGSEWAVSSHAANAEGYMPMCMMAFILDGHVRTGMEDTVYLRPGELAGTNAELVEQWVDTARIWGRPLASPAEARKILGMASLNSAPAERRNHTCME